MICKRCGKECYANDGQFGKAVSHCCKDEIDYDQIQSCSHPNFTGTTGSAGIPLNNGFNWTGLPDSGMSLRDYFAAKAMQGFLSSPLRTTRDLNAIAIESYNLADAMLKAREK